ncbi:hypothetical protein MMC07_005162 [Pseudocyphellaria aurata]|nr:hypothetical protein [Pseudocyphellaria aurata]
MEPQSLQTASSYINNLLLSRGLLRNGVAIEFASPSKAEGGIDATMAKVMNLVHDLILRRDRETDTLSTVAQNLQSLRTSSAQQSQVITRLETRNADLDRQLALSAAQERAARATLRSAETRTKAMREEMTRLKGTVAQIRGQCANDVRRRDGEIKKLKRHLEGRRGRDGNGGQIGIVVVKSGTKPAQQGSRLLESEVDLGSPEYSLKQETTEFLTQLSQCLSDENDALIGLVRSTLATLRSLQGLPKDSKPGIDGLEDVEMGHNNMALAPPPSYEDLAADTDDVLEHLRGLLTNPSFVPLEEVEIREDEIIRLRIGWEKMEARWKEAVALMDGWRKRMVDTGDSINLDDLRVGLNLGSAIPPLPVGQEASILKQELFEDSLNSSKLFDHERNGVDELSIMDPIDTSVDELDETKDGVLAVRSTNARPALSPRKVSFSPILEENTKQLRDEEAEISLLNHSPCKSLRSPEPQRQRSHQIQPYKAFVLSQSSRSHTRTSIQSPRSSMPSSPRTVAQKLAMVQAEAEEVRKRDETKSLRKPSGQLARKLKGSRRRSTLTPEEMGNLLGCK